MEYIMSILNSLAVSLYIAGLFVTAFSFFGVYTSLVDLYLAEDDTYKYKFELRKYTYLLLSGVFSLTLSTLFLK